MNSRWPTCRLKWQNFLTCRTKLDDYLRPRETTEELFRLHQIRLQKQLDNAERARERRQDNTTNSADIETDPINQQTSENGTESEYQGAIGDANHEGANDQTVEVAQNGSELGEETQEKPILTTSTSLLFKIRVIS